MNTEKNINDFKFNNFKIETGSMHKLQPVPISFFCYNLPLLFTFSPLGNKIRSWNSNLRKKKSLSLNDLKKNAIIMFHVLFRLAFKRRWKKTHIRKTLTKKFKSIFHLKKLKFCHKTNTNLCINFLKRKLILNVIFVLLLILK